MRALHHCARSPCRPSVLLHHFTRPRAAAALQAGATPTTPRAAMAASTTTATAAPPAATTAAAAAAAWTPAGATQDEFMLRDQCIVVDEADNVTGAASKLDCHRFSSSRVAAGGAAASAAAATTGRLHRAFSVFLFDASGRLLLQQRAASKITFPGVWTNTCCSHQLHGQPHPGELDDRGRVESRGEAPGAVAAARRKLEHELGISPADLPASCFTFVTRLHYCAPDSATHGPDPQWGEHEVDYILLARMQQRQGAGGGDGGGVDGAGAGAGDGNGGGAATAPAAASGAAATGGGGAGGGGDDGVRVEEQQQQQHAWEVPPSSSSTAVAVRANARLGRPALAPDCEEVAAVRWVTATELERMMRPDSGLRWSPWFRIIAREWLLPRWWRDLEGALAGRHGDYARVHRIDCQEE